MKAKIAISIVVPIFNEEDSIPFLVDQLLKVMRSTGEKFELVLINEFL